MSEKYIQIAGPGKDTTIVTVFEDKGHELVLETERGFRYGVSSRDFNKHYMLLDKWKEQQKKD